MVIPDCYDPIRQAERRERDWDKRMQKIPVCALCQKPIFPGSKIHTSHNAVVCSFCVEQLNEDFAYVEDSQ